MHRLGLRVRSQTSLAQLTTDTTLFDTAEGDAEIRVVGAVDPNHAGFDAASHPVGTLDVAREQGAAQTVRGVVGHADGLLFGLERRDHDEGAKDFLAVDSHVVLDAGEDGGFNEESLAVADVLVGNAACRQGRALGFAGLDVSQNSLVLRLGDLRALESVVRKWIAHLGSGLDHLLELLHKLIEHAFLNEDTRGRGANLTHVGHDANVSPFGGLLEISVVKNQQWRLATGLQGDVLHVHAGGLHDHLAGRGATGECDLVNVQMGGESVAGFFTISVHDVNHARRENLRDQTSKEENGEGSLFGGLQHDGVSAGKSGTEFPGGHGQRVVPGNDLAADSNGLLQGIGELLRRCGNRLSMDLVCPSRVVSYGADDLAEILVQRNTVWLSIVPCFQRGKRLFILLQQVGELVHQSTPIGSWKIAPGGVIEGGSGSFDGLVDVVRGGGLDRANLLLIPRGIALSQSVTQVIKAAWGERAQSRTHEGLMLVILSPELDLTNSLLIKRPVGRVIFFPLGAVNSTLRSAILECCSCEVLCEKGRSVTRRKIRRGGRERGEMQELTEKDLRVGGASDLVKDVNIKKRQVRIQEEAEG